MDEANKIKEETTDVELTTATLAGVDARPMVRAVAGSTSGVGSASSAGAATAPAIDGPDRQPLFSSEEAKDFRARWDAIQVSFVDDPRLAVGQADSLVTVAMKRLAEMFATERAKLEANGIAAIISGPRISVLHCAAIGRFSAGFSRCSKARAGIREQAFGLRKRQIECFVVWLNSSTTWLSRRCCAV